MKNGIGQQSDKWEVVSAYTREMAINDGVLVDVTEGAKGAWRVLVDVTRSVYERYIVVPPGAPSGQDLKGRLWDVVYMARFRSNIVHASSDGSTWLYKLSVANDYRGPKEVTLKAHLGPGDSYLEPVVLTIMLPSED